MSRINCYLGKSLENTLKQTKVSKALHKRNYLADLQQSNFYENFQSFDDSLYVDEQQHETMLALDFAHACIVAEKDKDIYFLETEDKRELYQSDDPKDKASAYSIFHNIDLKEKKLEPKKNYNTPLSTGPSLLEKLAGTTKAKMTYNRNCSERKSLNVCVAKVYFD